VEPATGREQREDDDDNPGEPARQDEEAGDSHKRDHDPPGVFPTPREGLDGERRAAVVNHVPRQDAFAHRGDLDRAVLEIAIERFLVVFVREPFRNG
jgi:hypothetical protein